MGQKMKEKGSSSWRPMWTQSGTDKTQISLHSVYKAPHGGLGLHAADQCKQSPSTGPLLAPFGRPPSAFYDLLSIVRSRHSSPVFAVFVFFAWGTYLEEKPSKKVGPTYFFILSDP